MSKNVLVVGVTDGEDATLKLLYAVMKSNEGCFQCKHFGGMSSCTAYPRSIPADILAGRVVHTSAYKGDQGIRFERKEEELP